VSLAAGLLHYRPFPLKLRSSRPLRPDRRAEPPAPLSVDKNKDYASSDRYRL